MKLIALIGICTGAALTSQNEFLAFMTRLSPEILARIKKITGDLVAGNVCIADLKKNMETKTESGDTYPISLSANYEEIYNTVTAAIKKDGPELFLEETLAITTPIDFLNISKKSMNEYFDTLERLCEENNIEVFITDSVIAQNLAYFFTQKYPDEEFLLVIDQPFNELGVFNLEAWNSWRIYAREMCKTYDEFPYLFAGVKPIANAMPNEEGRPMNLCTAVIASAATV